MGTKEDFDNTIPTKQKFKIFSSSPLFKNILFQTETVLLKKLVPKQNFHRNEISMTDPPLPVLHTMYKVIKVFAYPITLQSFQNVHK